ncbi:MAG: pre-16S rRNA-processing nuclease YqgF [Fimbriimonadaceae bacterium]
MHRVVLAIDPGSSKCGLALVERDAELNVKVLWRSITPRDQVLLRIEEAARIKPFRFIVMGQGTSSRKLVEEVREKFPSAGILLIDESNTSVGARERYWENNPRKGWRKLLPASMQVPPEPVDDFAALILAERVLETQ